GTAGELGEATEEGVQEAEGGGRTLRAVPLLLEDGEETGFRVHAMADVAFEGGAGRLPIATAGSSRRREHGGSALRIGLAGVRKIALGFLEVALRKSDLAQQNERSGFLGIQAQRRVQDLTGFFELRAGRRGGGEEFALALKRAAALRIDAR